MNVGEVWVLRCVGEEALCLILTREHDDDDSEVITYFNLETGKLNWWREYPTITVGDRVGQWRKWESC